MIRRRDVEPDKPEMVQACPECDSSAVVPRQPQKPSGSGSSGKWYCRRCTAHFDEPTRRRARADTAPSNGSLAHELLKADPDDVSG